MKRSEIWKIFKAKGISLHPAGKFLRNAETGAKMIVEGRDDFLDIRSCEYDNFLKYRPELHNLFIVDIDDLKSVIDDKVFDNDMVKLLESTFHYYTSSTNKMHYVFRGADGFKVPEFRKTHDTNRFLHKNIDIITYGIVFTGHFYSDKDTKFKIFDKDIIEIDEDIVKLFIGDDTGVDSNVSHSSSEVKSASANGDLVVIEPKRNNWSGVSEGSRNDELFKSCCSELACNISEDEIYSRAVQWNSGLREPLGIDELETTFKSAVRTERLSYPNGRDYSNVVSDDGFDVVTTFVENYNLETGEFESDAFQSPKNRVVVVLKSLM